MELEMMIKEKIMKKIRREMANKKMYFTFNAFT